MVFGPRWKARLTRMLSLLSMDAVLPLPFGATVTTEGRPEDGRWYGMIASSVWIVDSDAPFSRLLYTGVKRR